MLAAQRRQRLSRRQARPPLEPDQQLGRLLDPAADRLYILSTLVGLTWREILPLWLTAALLARELVLLVMVGILRRHGYPPPQVNFLGKAATFNLMYAFPLLLLSDGSGWLASLAAVFGWAFAGWGTTLYWWAGILYVVQVRRLVRADTWPIELAGWSGRSGSMARGGKVRDNLDG